MLMARNAGVRAVGVAWGYHAPSELIASGALSVAESVSALAQALEEALA
jgi:phosphoglycolate phosphatase